MPIFISHSTKDRNFADTLGANLVMSKHHIWMDRWELNIGDSLLDRIQQVLADSTAIIVLLSKNSVESEWCRREINAGLMRELAERKSLLMPCVIEDCVVPLFLQDKVYADFRTDADEALEQLKGALAKVSNPRQGRNETPRFNTDWSLDWKSMNGIHFIEWTFVDHGHQWPYVVLSKCTVVCNSKASINFAKAQASNRADEYMRDVLGTIMSKIPTDGLFVRMQDAREQTIGRNFERSNGEAFDVQFSYRRLGEDNGFDTVVYLDNNLRVAMDHMVAVTAQSAG
ncbi:TIR domain-containing protein [Sinorhizobium medicae]|nr:TIR domain-containing protein [Sinorhizobium medicae]MDX0894984.1 TIR domain-containing protein [Sinorhizobium medicae]